MQDNSTRDRLLVTIRHGFRNRPRHSQNIHERQGLFAPEPPPPIPNARVVAQQLREGPSIQPLQDDKPDSLARRAGSDQGTNVGMIQARVNRQFAFHFVDGQDDVLTFGFECLDDDGFLLIDGGVDPGIATVCQVLDVGKLTPGEVEGSAGNAGVFVAVVTNGGGSVLRDVFGLTDVWLGAVGRMGGRSIEQTFFGEGIDGGGSSGEGHVYQKFDGGGSHQDSERGGERARVIIRSEPTQNTNRSQCEGATIIITTTISHHIPPYTKINDRHIGMTRRVTDGNGHRRPHIAHGAAQGLGPVGRVRRDPDDVLRLLGPLAEGRTEAVRSFGGLLAVVDVDEVLAHRVFEGGGAQVRIGELVGLGARPQPDFGDVEAHDFAGSCQDSLDGGGGLAKETVLVE